MASLAAKRYAIAELPPAGGISYVSSHYNSIIIGLQYGGSVDEWLACWTQAQKGPGSNRSRDAVG